MTTTQLVLPTIVNLPEAECLNTEYSAVITAGPSRHEVKWGHPNHFVRTFDDVISGPYKPTVKDMQAMLDFSANNTDDILIHCHAGMSRSTATAWGVAIQRGFDPFEAYDALLRKHPEGRMFWPNDALVAALERIFDIRGLSEYNETRHYRGAIRPSYY